MYFVQVTIYIIICQHSHAQQQDILFTINMMAAYINYITIQPGIGTESYPSCFCCGLFLRLVGLSWVLWCFSNDSIYLCQADSQLWFITRLADVFVHRFSCFVWYFKDENGSILNDLAVFCLDVAFACHTVAIYLFSPTLLPYRSAIVVLAMPGNKTIWNGRQFS